MILFIDLVFSAGRWIRHLRKRIIDHAMPRSERHEASRPGVGLFHALDDADVGIPSDGDAV